MPGRSIPAVKHRRARTTKSIPPAGRPASSAGLPSGLTPAQYKFCLAYLENGFNGTQAYLEAHPRVTLEAAQAAASRALRSVMVRAFLDERLEAAWGQLRMGGDEALARIAMIAREAPDDRVKLAALKVILEQTGKLKPQDQGFDALAEAIRQTYREHGVPVE